MYQSADYGRTRRDLMRAEPFVFYLINAMSIWTKNLCVHLPYSADWHVYMSTLPGVSNSHTLSI